VSPSVRHTCPGSTPRWSATPSPTCPHSASNWAKFRWPLNKTTSVDKCAAAFVAGIEGRKERVYCPGWVGVFRWLKPFLSTSFGDSLAHRHTGDQLARMDAEVGALGRSTSAYNQELEKY
jgi:hypothetical protein